ncbi:hypothetical protein [Sessilibacter corallicola]|uniref:Sulfotransferase family protein n=1 Tax=Sessilibacter corallicola TaxID=2904075 RepID=A0ABQ0A836_9GAMM
MKQIEVDLIRDIAISLEEKSPESALKLMQLASQYRPRGAFIIKKMKEYEKNLLVDNGHLNMHFGVHKTGTTYIQENLEQITNPNFHYTKLETFREIRRKHSYLTYLKSLDFKKKIVISDENMIGGNGTILTGRLYPHFHTNVNSFLFPFKNRNLINIYISIRPMTSFLPSQYCEYLRWNKYVSYKKFTSKVIVEDLSWREVLFKNITHNKDLNFKIFDFRKFSTNKDKLLRELSFGLMDQCLTSINRSRSSFTYKEISQLSDGEYTSNNDQKFDPHTIKQKKRSSTIYNEDLKKLNQLPNVSII